jgi:hypothetical protein
MQVAAEINHKIKVERDARKFIFCEKSWPEREVRPSVLSTAEAKYVEPYLQAFWLSV